MDRLLYVAANDRELEALVGRHGHQQPTGGMASEVLRRGQVFQRSSKPTRTRACYPTLRGPAIGNNDHALLWNGTAASAFDLHPFVAALNPSFTNSNAIAISENGTIVGLAGNGTNQFYAVLSTPVPEPASCVLVACRLALATRLRSRRRRAA